jgi:hypothetical protein
VRLHEREKRGQPARASCWEGLRPHPANTCRAQGKGGWIRPPCGGHRGQRGVVPPYAPPPLWRRRCAMELDLRRGGREGGR